MLLEEIAEGLFRWRAPHPEWSPGAAPGSPEDWGPLVGSVLFETPAEVALIDPQLPEEERSGMLEWLDRKIGQRPVRILTTLRWHRRDREQLAERYRAQSPGAWNAIPKGVQALALRGAGETLFWLPRAATLVAGDRLIADASGTLSVCPESWLADVSVDRAGLAHLLRPLLELAVERVLVSHGDPVLHDGRAAIARAIAEAGS